jgi:hypothetical protein
MKESYYVGAYWLARQETAEDCARRAEAFFRLLTPCDPSLTYWFAKGWTLDAARKNRFEPKMEEFLGVFHQQKTQGPKGGFSLEVWNGEMDESASSISLHCADTSKWVSNVCLVDLPDKGVAAERLLQVSVLTRILRGVVVIWEPEWAVVTSSSLRNMQTESGEAGTFVGWITYFSHRRGRVPPLPFPVQVEPVEDKGSLVILTPERFSTSNSAHVALAHHVAEQLARADLLGPLRPWDG